VEDELSVAIHPLGDSLSQAGKIKWQVKSIGITNSSIERNPFKDATSCGYGTVSPPVTGDPLAGTVGVFLMDVDLQNPPELPPKLGMGISNTRLFLKLKVEPGKHSGAQ
jgi:hypothetical protein